MSAVWFDNRARLLSIVVLALVVFGMSFAPARADETRFKAAKQRAAASLNLANAAPGASSSRATTGFLNGFVYAPGPQSALGFRGRLNVGRTGVYVPYYGNVGADPLHSNVQGVAGIGYGFRGWDISVLNGGYTPGAPSLTPGTGDLSKVSPSLSVSVHF